MAATTWLGALWGRKYTWATDGGDIAIQGYDNGVQLTTPEAVSEGWCFIHATDDPDGDPDVLVIGGRKFRLVPGQ